MLQANNTKIQDITKFYNLSCYLEGAGSAKEQGDAGGDGQTRHHPQEQGGREEEKI